MSDTSMISPASPFEVVAKEAERAIERGDWAAAEASLRKCVDLQPDNVKVREYLGLSLGKLSRHQESVEVLEPLLAKGVQITTIIFLAEQYEALGRTNEAWHYYKQFLKKAPKHAYGWMKFGQLKDRLGDKPGARECYRQAYESNPDDIDVTSKYTNAIWAVDPEKALGYTERLLDVYKDNPEYLCAALNVAICQKEWYERIKRGLMPYHAYRLDELFFDHALEHVKSLEATYRRLLAAKPDNPSARVGMGTALFCLKDFAGAEAIWNTVPTKTAGHILETVRFSPAFYDELRGMSDADLTRSLPPLIEVTMPQPDPKGVLYLSCNYQYFYAFALPMIVSSRERSPETPVHVHIMDADEEKTQFAHALLKKLAPLKFALSVERPGLKEGSMPARCYYHAVRFIRYYEHLQMYNCPLWLMDVDAVVHSNLGGLFGMLEGHDVAMRIRPGRMEPWNQFNACIVGGSQTPASLEYFRLIAAYVAHFHQRGMLRWGIDQLAMFGVFMDMQARGAAPSLQLLGEREVDYDYREDGFVWCNSGASKFHHLRRVSNPGAAASSDPEKSKFADVFEQRWREVQALSETVLANRK